MADFHFLRPWWLALLPVAIWLIWQVLRGRSEGGGWRALVDAPLRAHELPEEPRRGRQQGEPPGPQEMEVSHG